MRPDRASLRRLVNDAKDRAITALRSPAARWRLAAHVGVAIVFAIALRILFTPFFANTALYGFRDWDAQSTYHYVTVLALKRYHELPWWHPWLCGGFPAWAYVEGAVNLVSPYLPLYLIFPIQIAERLEVIGQTACALLFAYLLAGRFTKSAGLRALVAVAYGINGRWLMQAAEGHMWHLQFAWMPLVILLFDLSLEPGKSRCTFYAGAVLALMAYMGGIYPLPHTGLALLIYAGFIAADRRTLQPFVSLVTAGATAVGLAAPKLFPLVDLMSRYPRRIDSTEALGLGQLLSTLTERAGSIVETPPVSVPVYGWYEYGIYVGLWITLTLFIAVIGPSERGKPTALRATGIVFMVLGCGAFHELAPWTLLHRLPSFSSQHVPSRFEMTGVLFLALTFVALVARLLDRAVSRFPVLDLALLAPVFYLATDIATVGERSTKEMFILKAPQVTESAEFHHVPDFPQRYEPNWNQLGRQDLLAMFANTGVIGCYGVPHEIVIGATAQGAPGYRGEAYVVGSSGSARVTSWTPNTATVRYEGASPGAKLVYNMNYDPSWRADGRSAESVQNAVGTTVTSSSGEVSFRYYPRMLNWGLLACALTLFGWFRGSVVRRLVRARRRAP